MSFDESDLKARFDQAVGTVQPDVSSLTRGSTLGGQRLQRRRRITTGLGAAAATALIAGGAAYFGSPADLLGSPTEPAESGPSVIQLAVEPATPRGLAAAVMSHIDGAERFGASGSFESNVEGVSEPVLMANLGYTFGTGDRYIVSAAATTDPALAAAICSDAASFQTCTEQSLADGTQIYRLEDRPDPGNGPEVTSVVAVRADQVVAVTLLGATSAYGAEMPLSPAELQAIVTDPYVGIFTSALLNERGKDIEPWGGDVYRVALTEESSPPRSAAPPSSR